MGSTGVGILMKDKLWGYVKECSGMRLRFMWMEMTLGCEKWVFENVYGLHIGSSNMEERGTFWALLRDCLIQFRTITKK